MNEVLLLEDDETNMKIMADILDLISLTAEKVTTISEARDMILKHPAFKLIMLDFNLPDGCGLELVKDIRKTHGDIPVMLVTAAPTKENIDLAASHGVKRIIGKPFNIRQMISQVEEALA